ncbi:MAG: heme transporter CcmC, partial [Planctomycetota bacterium]
ELDRSGTFDTPTLRELWRTGPYLHDGRAQTLRQVLVECNPDDRHGRTSHLSEEQLEDLIMYLRSL